MTFAIYIFPAAFCISIVIRDFLNLNFCFIFLLFIPLGSPPLPFLSSLNTDEAESESFLETSDCVGAIEL